MDLSDITKVASRKRINADAENLREKVSQEAAKIIKLRVGQDTSYWELKEKLGDVEREHARLQQNMVDMQMQHETLSSQYQDELRLRPETLNKLASTRDICDVLEEYIGRVRGTLQRCAADKAALGDAYVRASAAVGAARDDIERRVAAAALQARADTDRLKAEAEWGARLAAQAEAARRHSEEAAAAARAHLADASSQAQRLQDQRDSLAEQLARQHDQLEEREHTIAELRDEVKRLAVEFSTQNERMKTMMSDLERESNAAAELREALEVAETRGEGATSEAARVREALAAAEARGEAAACEAARLHEALAAAEARGEAAASDVARLREALATTASERDAAMATVDNLERQWQESIALSNELKLRTESLLERNKDLLKETDDKSQSISSLETRVVELESEIATLAAEVARLTVTLRDVTAELNATRAEAERNAALAAERGGELDSTRQQLDKLRKESATAAGEAERERAERADTIAQLMRDVTQEAEARARCEAALATVRADLEVARAGRLRAEDEVRRLDVAVRSKEKEAADQMKIILEMRDEKERLQDKICGMQSRIDNIQKELVRDPAPPAASAVPTDRDPPEHDDNAVAAPPKSLHKEIFAKPKKSKHSAPGSRNVDTMLYNFLSDSSMEADATFDSTEVTRRFEALSRGYVSSSAPRPFNQPDVMDKPTARTLQAPEAGPVSLSQVREALSARGRTFFKNKRTDTRHKKQK